MATLSNLMVSSLRGVQKSLINPTTCNQVTVRHASKKSSTCTRIKPGHPRPKHRGWKVQDGHQVPAGKILATQLKTRFHPGLNVGFGKNGTLFAMEPGKVVITCEKVDLKWDHTWIQRCYGGREGQVIYKKHFHVLPEKQHNTFKLIDRI